MPPKKGKEGGKDDKKKKGKEKVKVKGMKEEVRKIPPPPACFSPDELQKFKELFRMFDEEHTEKMPLKPLPEMLRKLGFNPKEQEIKEIFKTILEDDLQDTFEIWEFYQMIEMKVNMGDDIEKVVMDAFAFLGNDEKDDEGQRSKIVNYYTVLEELMKWGEVLTEKEVEDIPKIARKLKCMVFETGEFYYEKFIDAMNSRDVKFLAEPVNFFKFDQKTLAAMAMQKAQEEKEENDKKEAARLEAEERQRQKMIEAGLIMVEE